MAESFCSFSLASIPFHFPGTHTRPKLRVSNFHFLSYSSASYPSTSSCCCSISKLSMGSKNGALSTLACSTLPFTGRVGWHRRDGNVSLLYFGMDRNAVAKVTKRDWSQILSAMLPFVVATTAIAALAQPSTFTWWVLYLNVVWMVILVNMLLRLIAIDFRRFFRFVDWVYFLTHLYIYILYQISIWILYVLYIFPWHVCIKLASYIPKITGCAFFFLFLLIFKMYSTANLLRLMTTIS